MKRRDFIKKTAFAATLLSPLSMFSACRKPKINGEKIAVIGAGVAGLAAAKKLKEIGFVVTVFESQDKIGGRIRSNRTLGLPFDEGASWIHGAGRNPIKDIASSAGATTFVTNDDSVEVYDIDGSLYTDAVIESTETAYNSALVSVQDAGTQNTSFQTVFDNLFPNRSSDRLWKFMLSSYLEFDTAADMSDLSSIDFDDDELFSGDDQLITNGYDKVTDYLGLGLDVRLNQAVQSINYSGTKVNIATATESLEFDFVVVAVPLGVLKNNRIAFTPALPTNKQAAITTTQMGVVNKFLLTWDTPFWDISLQYIGFTPNTKGAFNYFLNYRTFSNHNALLTFTFGDYATASESMNDADITAEIMSNLRAIYGSNVPAPTQMLRTRWASNPHAFGSYSFPTNGARSSNFDELASSINSKVFFAGEHTNKDYRGTVHGAYLSGIREADNIIDLF
jgi:monoamine oxidase